MIDPKKETRDKLGAVPAILTHYAGWYPKLWAEGIVSRFHYREFGKLAPHVRFVERSCRKLARESFHGMALYQAKMERKQGFLFRCVDVVMELFAMAATLSRAKQMADDGDPEARQAAQLADLFCRMARKKVRRLLTDLWANQDASLNAVAASVMKGEVRWLEQGAMDTGLDAAAFETRSLVELRQAERAGRAAS
jgi:hypothetical protein